jgi:hypothetical protein
MKIIAGSSSTSKAATVASASSADSSRLPASFEWLDLDQRSELMNVPVSK